MTMTLERPYSAAESTPTVQWRAHQPGIWVAYWAGHAAGMIEEQWRRGFTATTRLGRRLGRFPTLDGAKAALERATAMGQR